MVYMQRGILGWGVAREGDERQSWLDCWSKGKPITGTITAGVINYNLPESNKSKVARQSAEQDE